jgi:hypothetical protein
MVLIVIIFLGIPPFLPRKLVGSLTSHLDHHQIHYHFVLHHDLILASRTLDLIFDWFSTAVGRRHISTFSRIDLHTLSNVKYLLERACNYIAAHIFLLQFPPFFLAISIWHLIVCIFLDDPVAIKKSPSFKRLPLDNVFWINRSLDCLPLPELPPAIELSLDVILRYSVG